MSIETLLEAARFLELQAQQQQKAREENELRDKLRLEQLAEHSISYSSQQPLHYTNSNHHNTNHVLKAEESPPLHYTNANRVFKAEEEEEPRGPHRHRPAPVPPPAIPITVIPMIPVVTTTSSSNRPATGGGLPSPHHHQPVAPRLLASPKWEPRHSPPGHQGGGTTTASSSSLPISPPRQPDLSSPSSSASALNHKQPQNHHQQQQHHLQPTPCANNNAKTQQTQQQQQLVVQQQRYPGGGTIVSAAPQPHALVAPPPPPPPPPSLLPQQATPPQTSPSPGSRGSPPDDGSGHHLDGKKRPGGAGTREVHNKLEKNRRAHLKECFDTLKKNIPNVDEKKTSNLSVLRSALRYIQTLKRKEKEYEHEMERLAREKIATQQRLSELKKELSQWMDVMEMERVLRQTVQPEEDQASTSTASEGEDIMDDDLDDDPAPRARPPAAPTNTTPSPQALQPELRPTVTTVTLAPMSSTPPSSTTSSGTTLVSIQHQQPLLQPPPQSQQAVALCSPQQHLSIRPTMAPYTPSSSSTPIHATLLPQPTTHHATLQPTVIAHAAASHASVIQAVNHVIQAGGPKHIAHLAPATTAGGAVQLTAAHHQHQQHPQPISHITVHPLPVAHLSQHLPALYSPQPVVAASQPAVVGHITHTLTHAHAHVNGTAPGQPTATVVGKQTPVGTAQVVTAHHPQLVGQTMTMVTMPSFPVSTLKLA